MAAGPWDRVPPAQDPLALSHASCLHIKGKAKGKEQGWCYWYWRCLVSLNNPVLFEAARRMSWLVSGMQLLGWCSTLRKVP